MSKASEAKSTGPRATPRRIAEKYDVSVRTTERWVEAGILPEPDRINGRKSWPPGTEPKFDAPGVRPRGRPPRKIAPATEAPNAA
jgi:hypothetical protein